MSRTLVEMEAPSAGRMIGASRWGVQGVHSGDSTYSKHGVIADKAMQDVFGAKYVSLHVRVTNQGAHHLYTQSLGYECARPSLELLLSCSCGAAQLDTRDPIT